jgi:hypothetical protein
MVIHDPLAAKPHTQELQAVGPGEEPAPELQAVEPTPIGPNGRLQAVGPRLTPMGRARRNRRLSGGRATPMGRCQLTTATPRVHTFALAFDRTNGAEDSAPPPHSHTLRARRRVRPTCEEVFDHFVRRLIREVPSRALQFDRARVLDAKEPANGLAVYVQIGSDRLGTYAVSDRGVLRANVVLVHFPSLRMLDDHMHIIAYGRHDAMTHMGHLAYASSHSYAYAYERIRTYVRSVSGVTPHVCICQHPRPRGWHGELTRGRAACEERSGLAA